MRINKFIAQALPDISRRDADGLVNKGLVTINGRRAVLSDTVDPAKDSIYYDGEHLRSRSHHRYLLFNKPAGCITAVKNRHGTVDGTVMAFFPPNTGLFPVGRLDRDTTGVLLFTSDGELSHTLTHPSFGVERVYRADVRGAVKDSSLQSLTAGITVDDVRYTAKNCVVEQHNAERNTSTVRVVLTEGKNREVKYMLRAVGHPVLVLHRCSFAGIVPDGVSPGSYRELLEKEVLTLKGLVGR